MERSRLRAIIPLSSRAKKRRKALHISPHMEKNQVSPRPPCLRLHQAHGGPMQRTVKGWVFPKPPTAPVTDALAQNVPSTLMHPGKAQLGKPHESTHKFQTDPGSPPFASWSATSDLLFLQ